jgi:hypothetical protein
MRSTSEEGMGRGGTGEEGPSKGELDGCIIHRVHTSIMKVNLTPPNIQTKTVFQTFLEISVKYLKLGPSFVKTGDEIEMSG